MDNDVRNHGELRFALFLILLAVAPACRSRSERAEKVESSAAALSQTKPTLDPDSRQSHFGRIVCALGDCDGDGRRDYAVGLQWTNREAGAVRVFSGAIHAAIFEVSGARRDQLGGIAMARLPDFDGDGIEDLAAGAGWYGSRARVVSMGKRRILFALDARPDQLVPCLDLDGDGTRDLLRCAGSEVTAFSGWNGRSIEASALRGLAGLVPLRTRLGMREYHALGLLRRAGGELAIFNCDVSLESAAVEGSYRGLGLPLAADSSDLETICASDFDGDSVLDLAEYSRIDDYDARTTEHRYTMRLRVFGSRHSAMLFERTWKAQFDSIPSIASCIALPGDLNGDEIPDIVVGVPFAFFAPGGVFAVSGVDGSDLWRLMPLKETKDRLSVETGVSLGVLSDVDRDLVEDVLVGCGSFEPGANSEANGAVVIVSGRTGCILHQMNETDVPAQLK